uniref:C2H2-type domain-containing protein n=1 Tax=Cajanus cajan TaxID=3821 RepID=A0A151TLI7_CAJCA|nr:hypothetical protein KK1_021537 [Cajanus cajan]
MFSKDKWLESKETKKREMKKINKIETKDRKNGKDDLKFKCDRCEKKFQSHQALGEHKGIHKKNEQGSDFDGKDKRSDVVDQKVFECS